MAEMFDIEELNKIAIDQVVGLFGVEHRGYVPCPYPHKKRNVKMKVIMTGNFCYCYDCKKGLSPINAAMEYGDLDFVGACKFLHETFSIPYLDGNTPEQDAKKAKVWMQKKREIRYWEFDPFKKCNHVTLKDYLPKYGSMNEEQQLKMLYTFFYRFSLETKQKAKFAYYQKERGIPSNNTYLKQIGYLSQEDIKELLARIEKHFPREDMEKYGVLKEKDGEQVFTFSYVDKGGLLVVPSFDLYTDMVTGFMLRPTHPPKWMKEKGVKELQLSKREFVLPLPFGLSCQMLHSQDTFFFTEGHPDLCSIPGNINDKIVRAGVASPGTHGISDEQLGLFRGKRCILVYDQDMSGLKAEHGYHEVTIADKKKEFLDTKEGRAKMKEYIASFDIDVKKKFHMGMKQKLILAGVKEVIILRWEPKYGGDINDLRINGNLMKVFKETK